MLPYLILEGTHATTPGRLMLLAALTVAAWGIVFLREFIRVQRSFEERYEPLCAADSGTTGPAMEESIQRLQRQAGAANQAGFTWFASCFQGRPPRDLIYVLQSEESPILLLLVAPRNGPVYRQAYTFLESERVLITTDDPGMGAIPQPQGVFVQVVENVEFHLLRMNHVRALNQLRTCGVLPRVVDRARHGRLLSRYRDRVRLWIRSHWMWRLRLYLWSTDLFGVAGRRYRDDLEDQIRREKSHANQD